MRDTKCDRTKIACRLGETAKISNRCGCDFGNAESQCMDDKNS